MKFVKCEFKKKASNDRTAKRSQTLGHKTALSVLLLSMQAAQSFIIIRNTTSMCDGKCVHRGSNVALTHLNKETPTHEWSCTFTIVHKAHTHESKPGEMTNH